MKRMVLAALVALIVAGCSNRPGETEIRAQIMDELLSDGRDRVYEVVNLVKVNGLPRDENTYYAEVEYDLRFKHGLEQAVLELQKETGSIFAAGAGAISLGVEYGDFRAGDVLHQQRQFKFVRTEKGWKLAIR